MTLLEKYVNGPQISTMASIPDICRESNPGPVVLWSNALPLISQYDSLNNLRDYVTEKITMNMLPT